MAVRREELQRDDLLARYLEASRRYETPQRSPSDGDLLLARYLQALDRYETPRGDVRTCTSCGRRVAFNHDDAGSWGVCSACDAVA
jgi:hypothetical protein